MKQKIKQTEIEKIPEGWTKISLRENIDVKHGYAFKGEYFTDNENDNVLLTPGNFNIGGGFKSDKFKFYNGEVPGEYVLSEGDIIITMTDLSKSGDTLGYSAKVPSINKKRLLHNQRLGKVIFKQNSHTDRDFLYWLLRTREYRNHILATASGTSVKHTSPSRILDYSFYCPSLQEQRAIASILGSLDDKIALNRSMNSTLESIGQALFKHWFIDFEFPNEKGKPYRSSGGEMMETELGEVPKGWRVCLIEEVATIIDCLHTKKPSRTEKGHTLLQVYNIGENGLIDFNELYNVSDEDYKIWTKNILVKEGDCILTNAGLAGALAQIPYGYEAGIGRNMTAVRPRNISPTYLFEYLFSDNGKKQIQLNTDYGTIFDSLNVKGIKKLKILIPDQRAMRRFETTARPLRKQMEKNIYENLCLSGIRDALLPKLMSGEIRVKPE